jgi:hypothetical protein
MVHGIRHEDTVGCLSGNVVMRFVRAPETIGSRRLAPAIQEWFAFQAKLDDIAGGAEFTKKYGWRATFYLKYLQHFSGLFVGYP